MTDDTDTTTTTTMITDTTTTNDHLGDYRVIRVYRDGDRDLTFTGWLLGEGSTSWIQGRKTEIRIYLTLGKKIVLSKSRLTRWVKEEDRFSAWVVRPNEALSRLMEDSYDGVTLGPASKDAWEQACRRWQALTGLETEVVD